MNASSMTPIRRSLGAGLALLLPLLAAGADTTPLIDKVRNATARYLDINVPLHEQWVVATPCVSGPDTGAMGVHLVLPSRLSPTEVLLDATQPQALIYEPKADGSWRLVGVEFIVLETAWAASNPPANSGPALQGNLLNYIPYPNRYGLPAFYEMHVWAWQDNPKGTYADWNTQVTCANQPLNPSF
ncbi:MAG: hypothetical protein WAN26_03110 [Steroidobacteraceae bacterium]